MMFFFIPSFFLRFISSKKYVSTWISKNIGIPISHLERFFSQILKAMFHCLLTAYMPPEPLCLQFFEGDLSLSLEILLSQVFGNFIMVCIVIYFSHYARHSIELSNGNSCSLLIFFVCVCVCFLHFLDLLFGFCTSWTSCLIFLSLLSYSSFLYLLAILSGNSPFMSLHFNFQGFLLVL